MSIPCSVPYGADQTVYLVVEAGGPATPVRQTERPDIESIVADLLSGRFSDPIEIVAFNTLEHWSEDLSGEIAREIICRCDIEGAGIPDHLDDFVGRQRANL